MASKSATVQYSSAGVEVRSILRTPENDVVDLSGVATASGGIIWFVLQKPDGSTARKATRLTSNEGSDGTVICVLNSNDLDQIGVYKAQVYVKSNTSRFYTRSASLEVLPNVDANF